MRDEGILVDPKTMPDLREQAVLYLLRRMRVDANLRYYMLGTEAFAKLCEAEAERTLKSVDEVQKFYAEMESHCIGDLADVVRIERKLERIQTVITDGVDHGTDPREVLGKIENILG